LYQGAQRWGIRYHIAGIPSDYADPPSIANFDPPKMTRLFQYGEELGEKGDPWRTKPPTMFKDIGPAPDSEQRDTEPRREPVDR
jgi:hypothetical protein